MDASSATKSTSSRPTGRQGPPLPARSDASKASRRVTRVEQLVDEILENYVSENLIVQSPAAPYIGPNPSPSAIPLPTIETMLEYPTLPHSIYETMCYGEDRVLPDDRHAQRMSVRIEHRAPVNKFGVREMETIKEDKKAEEKHEDSWLHI